LPQACEKIVQVVIAEFIKAVYEKVKSMNEEIDDYWEEKVINIKIDTLDKMDEIESKNEKPDVTFMKQFISDKTLN